MIVTVNVWLPGPLAFVAVMLPLNVPAVVGVPENNPVVALKPTPGIDTVVPQPPEGIAWSAVIWYENATPTCPVAVLELVIFGAGAPKAVVASVNARALPIVRAANRHLRIFVIVLEEVSIF